MKNTQKKTSFAAFSVKAALALTFAVAAAEAVHAAGTSAKWFRLTLKEKYNIVPSASELRLAELALYDEDGVQQGVGLTEVDATSAPSAMAEGTCFLSTPYTVSRGAAYLFDGKYSGSGTFNLSIKEIPVGSNGYAAMSADDPSTWSVVVARLPSSAKPVVSYLPYVGYYNWSGTERSANKWTLEASYDGENWFTVHDQSATGAVKPSANESAYNGGVAYVLASPAIRQFTVDSAATPVWPTGFYGADSLVMKTGSGTATAVGECGEAAVKVSEGTLALQGVAFTRYRFKIERVRGTGQYMEITEFRLLHAGEDVTGGYESVSNCSTEDGGGGSPSGEGPAKAVDGSLTTKFLDRSTASDSTSVKCWLELVYSKPRAIDGYNWASGRNNYWSGNDSRVPVAWRLQGSNDGETWYDLDVQDTSTFTPVYKASVWQSENGFDCVQTSLGAVVSVGEDAVLSIAGTVELESVVNGGTVALAAGAEAVFAPAAGEIVSLSGGGVTGEGGIVKSGEGTLEIDGDNAYSGDTTVESGTLRIGRGGAVSAKWFRLVLKQKYNWLKSDASLLRLAEWALYDAEGVQRNLSLAACGRELEDRLMPPGTCKVDCGYAVSRTNSLFNGVFNGVNQGVHDLYVSGIPVDASGYPAMSVDDPSTWITITLRLADDAAPVTGYNLFVGYYNWNGSQCSPARWTLEASYDGETWFTADDRTAADVPSPGSNEAGYNGGEPFAFTAGEGVAGAAVPASSVVEVASGARLEILGAARTISNLRIDCDAGAGVLSGFVPAVSGALYLVNAPSLATRWTQLPITLENAASTGNLAGWKVYADGALKKAEFRIDSSGGAKVRLSSGARVMVR